MNREEMKADLEREVAAIRKLQEFIDLLPDALFEIPGVDVSPSTGGWDGGISVHLPYYAEAYGLLERALSQEDWIFGKLNTYVTNGDCKLMCINHRNFSGPRVFVKFDPRLDGSHCDLVQIGVRKLPVYEIRCEEIPGLDIDAGVQQWGL